MLDWIYYVRTGNLPPVDPQEGLEGTPFPKVIWHAMEKGALASLTVCSSGLTQVGGEDLPWNWGAESQGRWQNSKVDKAKCQLLRIRGKVQLNFYNRQQDQSSNQAPWLTEICGGGA